MSAATVDTYPCTYHRPGSPDSPITRLDELATTCSRLTRKPSWLRRRVSSSISVRSSKELLRRASSSLSVRSSKDRMNSDCVLVALEPDTAAFLAAHPDAFDANPTHDLRLTHLPEACVDSAEAVPTGNAGAAPSPRPAAPGASRLRGAWMPDGSHYEGYWRDGNAHGRGTCLFASGSRYVGSWELGKMHGSGIYYWFDGEVDIVAFCAGRPGSGVRFSAQRTSAWTLEDGDISAPLKLAEARAVAERLGLAVPPVENGVENGPTDHGPSKHTVEMSENL